ncbi:signal transduction histidine kinase [Clostridium tetanomorphum]|uniref:histidine kinase n=1 Tax=Clostridium tetanomorphum TaxID=1553 RepID=A0A923J0N7_CLOTT|nr:sensor histidine kinase [Clostridium tetanomorphum]KAJ52395.1 histidine kinase-like ATPase [Clostridium tetanomorphum DSM 665]MBC2397914.1 sensor histidine kinase [Clostridium tetanomorphum]MBP1864770.1 signal transduction histidine kinase [Clostridium tetanomorphum]NRS83946.1 signal transduction histidine kinase [Clostridium tetanomorphum]NRZ97165.1 signal transduction histidine kinase [Clostridium tetanomorphum]
MWNKTLLISIRYFCILAIIAVIGINKINLTTFMVIFIFIFLINNQIRFFSLDKNLHKSISFILEIIFTVIAYEWIGGHLTIYLILAAIDSNTLFRKPIKHIFNIVIILEGIILLSNETLEFRFINIVLLIAFIGILYLIQDENDKKIEAQKLYDKLRISEEKLKSANRDLELYASSIEELTLLRERNRLSREIHDSVGHALSTMVIQLGAIERTIEKDQQIAKEVTKELRKFTQNSLNEVRMSIREIKPKEFEDYEGILIIEELIKNFKKLTGVEVRLAFTKEKWPLNADQSFVIYRIIQEFLANSVRHGKATIIQIFMAFDDYKLVVTLKDNGTGRDSLVEGIGLKSMRERVTELGGNFHYKTKFGEGFLARIELDKVEKLKIYSQEEKNGQD